jgi:hypothetical protein
MTQLTRVGDTKGDDNDDDDDDKGSVLGSSLVRSHSFAE